MDFFDFEELDREAVESVGEVLESIGADLGRRGRVAITPQEIVRGFIESTPMLTFEERAQLLGGVIEDQRATPSAAAGSRGSSTASSGSRTAPRPSGSTAARGTTTSAPAARRPGASAPAGRGTTPSAPAGRGTTPSARSTPTSAPAASSPGTGASRPGSTGGRTSSGASGASGSSGSSGSSPRSSPQSSRDRSGAGNAFSDVISHIPQAASLVQQGAQAIQQFSSPQPPPPPTAAPGPAPSFAPGPDPDGPAEPAYASSPPPAYAPPPQPAPASPPGAPPPFASGAMGDAQAGFDPVGAMSQALRQGRIPPLPGQLPSGTGQLAPPPMVTTPGARPPAEAIALLRMLLGLPQLLSALLSAAVLGPAGPRTMELPIPTAGTPGGVRNLQVPLGAVMNAIATLAGRSMEELNASTQESDPEVPDYLVGEDGELLVDPANAAERAALLTHMVRLNQAAQRAGWSAWAREADEELDEAEAWARDAGF